MRFTTIATVLVASACAAFALPAEADDAVLVPRREPGDFELRVFRTTSYSDLDYKVYRKAGTYTFNFDARSWLYYDAGCCVSFCKDRTSTGYRCNADSSNSNVLPQNRFNKVAIKCFGGIPSC